jgi:hypothetical protein
MLSKKIFEDLTKDCPCHQNGDIKKWCFCRAMVEAMQERMIMQFRLIVDYQYNTARDEKRGITLEEATSGFVEKGYAKKFGETYQDEMTREDLFPLVFGYDIQMPSDEEIKEHLTNN